MGILPLQLIKFRTQALFALLAAVPLTVQASGFNSTLNNGIFYESSDNNFKLRVGGRLHLDGGLFGDRDRDSDLDGDLHLRRARLSAQAELFYDWRLSAQLDLANPDNRYHSLRLRYDGFTDTRLTLGLFQGSFSLEEATSSNNFVFTERSLSNALAPGINVGLELQRWGKNWSSEVGVFREADINQGTDQQTTRKGGGFNGRFTLAPVVQENWMVHLGTSVSYRIPGDQERVRIRARPESRIFDEYLISSGWINKVDSHVTAGVEGVVTIGQFALQGESIRTRIYRAGDRQDETFDGGYLFASWLLNGGRRTYSHPSGVFGKIKPNQAGAWEVAVRRSFLDLDSSTGSVRGGKQTNTTWALNWHPNENIRLMFNYIHTETNANAGDGDPAILQMRLQWAI